MSKEFKAITLRSIYKNDVDKFGVRLFTGTAMVIVGAIGIPMAIMYAAWVFSIVVALPALCYLLMRTQEVKDELNKKIADHGIHNRKRSMPYFAIAGSILHFPVNKEINCGNTMVDGRIANSYETFQAETQNSVVLQKGKLIFKQTPTSGLLWEQSFASANEPNVTSKQDWNRTRY